MQDLLKDFLSKKAQKAAAEGAKSVEQLKNDISIEPVAQQFSQSASSGQGGYIGWVVEGQLDKEIINEIKELFRERSYSY